MPPVLDTAQYLNTAILGVSVAKHQITWNATNVVSTSEPPGALALNDLHLPNEVVSFHAMIAKSIGHYSIRRCSSNFSSNGVTRYTAHDASGDGAMAHGGRPIHVDTAHRPRSHAGPQRLPLLHAG